MENNLPKILYPKPVSSRKNLIPDNTETGDLPESLQTFTRPRSQDSLICLHLFKLSDKDLLLSTTPLQRLTNPKKSCHLNLPNMVSCSLGGGIMGTGEETSGLFFCSVIIFYFHFKQLQSTVFGCDSFLTCKLVVI